MRYFVGIDLGSTTTKAIILGDSGAILGRGITNSRSNYDVACQIAVGEALNNARFSLMDDQMKNLGMEPAEREIVLLEFGEAFRLQQYLSQLSALHARLLEHADAGGHGTGVESTVSGITDRMAREAEAFFRAGANRKSDFFRDLAGSRYLELAEEVSRSGGPCFDVLIGLFDKAILEVENTNTEAGFEAMARKSLASLDGAPAAAVEALETVLAVTMHRVGSVGTGYGRQRLRFPKEQIRSEILCHGLGAHAMFPRTRTVLDIGGQDTKAIQVDSKGIVTSFQMNDRCAAGCGRYLGYIADEMNLGLHELGPMADASCRPVRINSTCTVFAGAELRERLSLGERREDILAGLHRAIILRAMSLLARSGGIEDEFTFTGGVARNSAAVGALRQLVEENYGDLRLNISPDSICTGALGAALFARKSAERPDDGVARPEVAA